MNYPRQYHQVQSPIIIIGMHRSGTSMITRMLEHFGLFMGVRKDENDEAFFFRKLNDWLLLQSGGSWDNPEPIHYLLQTENIRPLVTDYLTYILKTPHTISYIGWHNYIRHRSLFQLDMPWGWKDPRNTFTLPIWLDLFPDAKVIHIYRHGVDVGKSLRTRQEKVLLRSKALHNRRKKLYLYWIKMKIGAFASPHLYSLESAFALWETYFDEARNQTRKLGERSLEIKYEEFLVDPSFFLRSLADFCGLSVTNADIANVATNVNGDRAFAYRTETELQIFSEKVAKRLEVKGY